MNSGCTTQMAFIFGGLLGQNVTFEGLTAFDGTTWTDAEAFLRRALGLHLGHFHAPFYIVLVRRLHTLRSLVGPEPLGSTIDFHQPLVLAMSLGPPPSKQTQTTICMTA
jgi:hypothetical protein